MRYLLAAMLFLIPATASAQYSQVGSPYGPECQNLEFQIRGFEYRAEEVQLYIWNAEQAGDRVMQNVYESLEVLREAIDRGWDLWDKAGCDTGTFYVEYYPWWWYLAYYAAIGVF